MAVNSIWGSIGAAAAEIGASLIIADKNNKGQLDAVAAGQTGSSSQVGVNAGSQTTTGSETSKTDTTTNQSSTSVQDTINNILSNSTLDETTRKDLESLLTSTSTSGTAESKDALSQIFGQLDPSKYGADAAAKAGSDASSLAIQQVLSGGMGDVLGAATTTGTFGSTAQAQLGMALQESAARGGTQANLQAQELFGSLRSKELDALLGAIRAGQAGQQDTTQQQNQTDNTTSSQTGSESSTQTGTTTGKEDTTQTGSSTSDTTGTSTTDSTTVDKVIGSSTDKANSEWIASQFK